MKNKEKNYLVYSVISFCFFTLLVYVGCDTFSLHAEFGQRNSATNYPPLILTSDSSILSQNKTTLLFPEGGLSPYSFETISKDLFYTDSDTEAGSVVLSEGNYEFVAGKSIGLVEILLRDSNNSTTSIEMTINPVTPVINSASRFPPAGPYQGVRINWTIDVGVEFVSIERRDASEGSSWEDIATADPLPNVQFTDISANESFSYYYRIKSVAGEYESSWSVEALYSPP